MIIQNGVGITTLLNADTVKQALSAANETVARGIYDPTTLSTVDADLATANIKNGITIFGKVGSADVHDISDATAIAAEVIDGETFYAVGGGIRTGTMPIVALAADNPAYPAGYHAGEANLQAVDAHLTPANIRSGVNIFGYTGPATVQEIGVADAVLGDVKNGKTFFSVTGGIKTGNLATVALDPGLNAYPAGYHAGEASLTAVDGDLVAGNIADGITIFGVLGTLVAGPVIDDVSGDAPSTVNGAATGGATKELITGTDNIETDFATKTLTFAAGSRAFAIGSIWTNINNNGTGRMRLYMGGVVVTQSPGLIPSDSDVILTGTRAMVGVQICKYTHWTGSPAFNTIKFVCIGSGDPVCCSIGVGSMKT